MLPTSAFLPYTRGNILLLLSRSVAGPDMELVTKGVNVGLSEREHDNDARVLVSSDTAVSCPICRAMRIMCLSDTGRAPFTRSC